MHYLPGFFRAVSIQHILIRYSPKMSSRILFALAALLFAVVAGFTAVAVFSGSDGASSSAASDAEVRGGGGDAPGDRFADSNYQEEPSIQEHSPVVPDMGPMPYLPSEVMVEGESSGTASLVPVEGGVVLIASAGCMHCHSLLESIAEASDGGVGLSHIRVVTVEGVREGRDMLDSLGLSALESWAPRDDVATFAVAIDITATPTTFLVDGDGMIHDRVSGIPGAAELDRWLEWARGEF